MKKTTIKRVVKAEYSIEIDETELCLILEALGRAGDFLDYQHYHGQTSNENCGCRTKKVEYEKLRKQLLE